MSFQFYTEALFNKLSQELISQGNVACLTLLFTVN